MNRERMRLLDLSIDSTNNVQVYVALKKCCWQAYAEDEWQFYHHTNKPKSVHRCSYEGQNERDIQHLQFLLLIYAPQSRARNSGPQTGKIILSKQQWIPCLVILDDSNGGLDVNSTTAFIFWKNEWTLSFETKGSRFIQLQELPDLKERCLARKFPSCKNLCDLVACLVRVYSFACLGHQGRDLGSWQDIEYRLHNPTPSFTPFHTFLAKTSAASHFHLVLYATQATAIQHLMARPNGSLETIDISGNLQHWRNLQDHLICLNF